MTVEELQAELAKKEAELLAKEENEAKLIEQIEAERKEKELIKTLADESGKTTESIKAMLEEKEKAYELTAKELESVKELANSNSEIAEKLKQQQKEREDIEAKRFKEEAEKIKKEAEKVKQEALKEAERIKQEAERYMEKVKIENEFKDKKAELIAEKSENKILIKDLKLAKTQEDIDRALELWDNQETLELVKMQSKSGSNVFKDIDKNSNLGGETSLRDRLKAKQAVYQATNIGHFGLGFERYTHFTSPIRRYSDLILHRLLKTIIKKDDKAKAHILKDIEAVTMTVSRLEREAAKVEWDFVDRKFVRWAEQNIGNSYRAIVTDVDEEGYKDTIAKIEDTIKGARVFMNPDEEAHLFDEITAEIIDVNIATTKIYAKAAKGKR